VGTVQSYWRAHMDLLGEKPRININDRSWIIHTKTEEQPPVRFMKGSKVEDSMISDGCLIHPEAVIERSILSPGVYVERGAVVRDSVVLTDAVIEEDAVVVRSIIDKKARIGKNSRVGAAGDIEDAPISMIGKNSHIPPGWSIEPGAIIGTDVEPSDFSSNIVRGEEYIQTRRLAYEV
jgi:glucose-1-phosphate adenylyltransferase